MGSRLGESIHRSFILRIDTLPNLLQFLPIARLNFTWINVQLHHELSPKNARHLLLFLRQGLVGVQHCQDLRSHRQSYWRKNINQTKRAQHILLGCFFVPSIPVLQSCVCLPIFTKRKKTFHYVTLLDVLDTLNGQTTAVSLMKILSTFYQTRLQLFRCHTQQSQSTEQTQGPSLQVRKLEMEGFGLLKTTS